jgi:hypothetical protein
MPRFSRAVPFLLTALVAVPACAQRPEEVTTISLQRTACFGTCPIYKVTLHRNGLASYDGRQFAKRTGSFRASMDSLAFARLAELIYAEGFTDLDTSYREPVTDMPTTFVCVRWATGSKCVEHYGLVTPPNFGRIENAIDSAAERLQWGAAAP